MVYKSEQGWILAIHPYLHLLYEQIELIYKLITFLAELVLLPNTERGKNPPE